jgi:hypothetical protein
MQWFPRFHTTGAELGYTPTTIDKWNLGLQGQRQNKVPIGTVAWGYDDRAIG